MLLHLGHVPVVVASSADAAREFIKNQDLIFSNRPRLSSPDRLIYGSRDVAFSPHGEYWRQIRSICVVQLLSNKGVQSYRHVREEETSLVVEKMRRLAASSPPVVVNLSDLLVSLTNNVFCRVALGRKYGEDGDGKVFRSFFGEFIELLGTSPVGDYVPWLAWGWVNRFDARMERVAKLFDQFLEQVVEEHRQIREKVGDSGVMDFVDVLLENRGSSPVEDVAIKALILDVFSAGTGTTSDALEWTMSELMRNPTAMKTLQNEVREAAGSKDEIEEEDLEKMVYLKSVIKESLRLHPPVPLLLPHESTQDTKVLGFGIVCGTRVVINARCGRIQKSLLPREVP